MPSVQVVVGSAITIGGIALLVEVTVFYFF